MIPVEINTIPHIEPPANIDHSNRQITALESATLTDKDELLDGA